MLYRITTILCLTLFFLSFGYAQNPFLVKDIHSGVASAFEDERTGIKVAIKNKAVFIAKVSTDRFQLMVSDGTELGTLFLLPDYSPDSITLSDFLQVDSICWFVRTDATGAAAIWSTDGTPGGTFQRYADTWRFSKLTPYKGGFLFRRYRTEGFENEYLSHFQPSDSSLTDIGAFTSFAGLRDFTVTSADTIYAIGGNTSGRALYKSGGGFFSMVIVKTINTGSEFNTDIFMYPVGNKVYFFWQKSDTNEPYKLWVSDGTENGTVGLKEFERPFFTNLIEQKAIIGFNNKLYFSGKIPDNDKGFELCISDGTVAGTKLLKDIKPGLADAEIKNMVVHNNRIWFAALDEFWNNKIWSTTGNATVTTPFSSYGYSGRSFAIVNDSLLTLAYSSSSGAELVSFLANANSIRTVSTLSAPSGSNFFGTQFTVAEKSVFFAGQNTDGFGSELWVYFPPQVPSSVNTADVARDAIVLSPNPAQLSVNIRSQFGNRLRIYDMLGRLAYETDNFADYLNLDIFNWTNGIYQLVFEEDGQLITKSFVKQ